MPTVPPGALAAALADPDLLPRLVKRATHSPDPLDEYEARAVRAAELREEFGRVADEAPAEARRRARAVTLLAELTAAQSAEACARHNVQVAEAHLARWPQERRQALVRVTTLPLWLASAMIVAIVTWMLALTIMLLGLATFTIICAGFKSSRHAWMAHHSAVSAARKVGATGVDALRSVFAPLAAGTTACRNRLQAACEQASAQWENAAVALLQAERGMPYTEVYPLAGFTEDEAARVELGVAVIRGADRATA